MSVALSLAKRGLGNVHPNPAVGCIIVQDSVIIGRGWTQPGGRPHAEIVAIENAICSTDGATAYITLEPCCHHGQSGPCVVALIRARIKTVVVAVKDPDPQMFGRGIKALEEAGVTVIQGVLQKEAEDLNIGFFYTRKLSRPFIVLKIASSLDGKIALANGKSKWITGEQTRNWVHKLRSEYDALMIGSGTLIADDPMLTCRLPGLSSPIRIVVDSNNRAISDHNLIKTAGIVPTWIVTNVIPDNPLPNIKYIEVSKSQDGQLQLTEIMQKLVHYGITRLLVEGGQGLSTALLKAGLVDRLIWCRAGKIIGDDGIAAIGNLNVSSLACTYNFKKTQMINLHEDTIEIWALPTST